MIAVPAAPLPPDEAARRAAAQPGAFWLSAPAADEVGVARDLVGDGARAGRCAAMRRRIWRASNRPGRRRARHGRASGAPPPAGVPAAVGWFSYDLGRAFSGLPARADDRGPAWPLVEVHCHDAVWVREAGGARDDLRPGRGGGAPAGGAAGAAGARDRRRSASAPLTADHPDARCSCDGVARVLEYLRAGDAYQVNLSRRLSATLRAGRGACRVALAAALRARAPAPHAALIASADGDGALVGNSPERFLAVAADGRVETRPIKGTRPRGGTPEADRAAAAALAASAKDRAEHVMIVDLERNDLGRVCRTGSVEVASLARAGRAADGVPPGQHGARRDCAPDVGLAALLEATFPGGSITGAPKRRAMQIIDELEPAPRGPYTGATGWLGAAGDLDLAIAIRTAVVRGGRLSLSVGGGVVADSTPEGELAETEVKARAFAALCGAGRRLTVA